MGIAVSSSHFILGFHDTVRDQGVQCTSGTSARPPRIIFGAYGWVQRARGRQWQIGDLSNVLNINETSCQCKWSIT